MCLFYLGSTSASQKTLIKEWCLAPYWKMLDYYIKLEAKLTSHPLVPSLSEVLKTLYQGCPVEPLVSCTVYIEKNPTTCF